MQQPSRQQITAAVAAILYPPQVTPDQLAHLMKQWWKNTRSSGGYRLSEAGNNAFIDAQIEHWDFEYIDDAMIAIIFMTTFAVLLDKKLTGPFYCYVAKGAKWIRVYDGRIATMMILGGVKEYIMNTENRQTHPK